LDSKRTMEYSRSGSFRSVASFRNMSICSNEAPAS
jgi:hypothetical protein